MGGGDGGVLLCASVCVYALLCIFVYVYKSSILRTCAPIDAAEVQPYVCSCVAFTHPLARSLLRSYNVCPVCTHTFNTHTIIYLFIYLFC